MEKRLEAEEKIKHLDNQITMLKQQNNVITEMGLDYKSRNEKAIKYIEKDTRWFDSKYASIYGELCDCEGANSNRLEVMVNPSNLLKILKGDDEND